jgi:hypothetical protein
VSALKGGIEQNCAPKFQRNGLKVDCWPTAAALQQMEESADN